MENLSCKIIDVDFKNKRRNFTFEVVTKRNEMERVHKNLSKALVDIKAICEDDKLYYEWVLGILSNIVRNLKGRL